MKRETEKNLMETRSFDGSREAFSDIRQLYNVPAVNKELLLFRMGAVLFDTRYYYEMMILDSRKDNIIILREYSHENPVEKHTLSSKALSMVKEILTDESIYMNRRPELMEDMITDMGEYEVELCNSGKITRLTYNSTAYEHMDDENNGKYLGIVRKIEDIIFQDIGTGRNYAEQL